MFWLGFLLLCLGAIFSISDLIGGDKAAELERGLFTLALRQRSMLARLGATVGRAVACLPPIMGIAALILPALYVALRVLTGSGAEELEGNSSWFTQQSFVAVAGSYVVITALGLMGYALLRSQLPQLYQHYRATWELRPLRFASLVLRHQSRHSRRFPHDPDRLGMTIVATIGAVAIVLITVLASIATRVLLFLVFGLAWLAWGAPTLVLGKTAQRLRNPSYFAVGKYLLLILGIAFFLLSRSKL